MREVIIVEALSAEKGYSFVDAVSLVWVREELMAFVFATRPCNFDARHFSVRLAAASSALPRSDRSQNVFRPFLLKPLFLLVFLTENISQVHRSGFTRHCNHQLHNILRILPS